MTPGSPIEAGLYALICAALDDRLRTVIERLAKVEAYLAKLEPHDDGLTYKQAARALGVTPRTIRRWIDSKKIEAGGGTPRSPRIRRSEVQRLLKGRAVEPQREVPATEGIDMVALAQDMLSTGRKARKRETQGSRSKS